MTETLANGYSSESTQRELSYRYPDDLVRMIFIFFCILVHLKKVASEGFKQLSLETRHIAGPIAGSYDSLGALYLHVCTGLSKYCTLVAANPQLLRQLPMSVLFDQVI